MIFSFDISYDLQYFQKVSRTDPEKLDYYFIQQCATLITRANLQCTLSGSKEAWILVEFHA